MAAYGIHLHTNSHHAQKPSALTLCISTQHGTLDIILWRWQKAALAEGHWLSISRRALAEGHLLSISKRALAEGRWLSITRRALAEGRRLQSEIDCTTAEEVRHESLPHRNPLAQSPRPSHLATPCDHSLHMLHVVLEHVAHPQPRVLI